MSLILFNLTLSVFVDYQSNTNSFSFALTSYFIITFVKQNFKEKYRFCEAGPEMNLILVNLT